VYKVLSESKVRKKRKKKKNLFFFSFSFSFSFSLAHSSLIFFNCRFQKAEYAPIDLFACGAKGCGLRAGADLKK
jgi:hypothetical protein